ncbi:CRAL/TRIO domain-containing protein [Meredithblackwellia eburnea MCA 4105]
MTSSAARPPLSSNPTELRLTGHLNHLTEQQEKALRQFKLKLENNGFYSPQKDGQDPSHDDVTLLRFLRARKFEVDGAYTQFTSSENWRASHAVPTLYDDFPVSDFTFSQTVYPQWTGRMDKSGLPVYVFKVGDLSKERIKEYDLAGEKKLEQRMIVLYEHLVQFVMPFCSSVPHKHQETPISATTNIVDISNVSLSRFWALRSHMQRASTLATANYAETLGQIYIIGAPNFFSVVWGWIGKWFDPGTVEKIFILKSDEVNTVLERFIDRENIPKAFGGELDWEFNGKIAGPSLDQKGKETLGLETLPKGSLRWVKGQLVVKGTGREEGEVDKIPKVEKSTKTSTPVDSGPTKTTTNGPVEPEAVKVNGQETSKPWERAEVSGVNEVDEKAVNEVATRLEGTTV